MLVVLVQFMRYQSTLLYVEYIFYKYMRFDFELICSHNQQLNVILDDIESIANIF